MPEYRLGKKPPNAGKTYPAEAYTPAEVRALMSAAPKTGPTGKRDRGLMAVQWRAGLRIGEAVALLPKDIDHEACTITVMRGKGHKRRTIGVDAEALALVEVWEAERAKLGLNGKHPLFCVIAGPTRGRELSPNAFLATLKRYGAKAGLERRVTNHNWRHTCAVDLHVREGVSTKLVQIQLGHASLSTTDRYLRSVAPADVVNVMRARTWNGAGAAVATPTALQLLQLLADPNVAELVAQLRPLV